MTTLTKGNTLQKSLPLLLALIVAGLAGNYFKFSIFLDIDFLFGSIFAMLALLYFGRSRGILAAAIIAGYTWFIWNEPYAIIIMTAEVAVVGWLMGRRRMGMVMADTLYWLFIGMPLGYLFYAVFMSTSPSNTSIIMTKQAVNGIANALVARLIFTGFAIRSRSSLISYKEIVYNLLAFFVLCPTLIMLAVSSRNDFNETDSHIRSMLVQDSRRVTDRVETWVKNRKSAIINLAEMAASRNPQQMQPYLEQAKKADINFRAIGLFDKNATSIAFYPLIDELGQNNLGKKLADRPYIATLQQTLKPMFSEIATSKIGIPRPRVLMLAPVLVRGAYHGYVIGVLDLRQIQEHLEMSTDENTLRYTLLDKNGNTIMTNRMDQKIMAPLMRAKGTFKHFDAKGISQWVPALPPNTPASEQWKDSFYVAETTIGDLAEWKLILEQPVAPFQKALYNQYTGDLILLFLIFLGALALAEFLSRVIVAPLEQLRTLTHELPLTLATNAKNIIWPDSGIKEAKHLISNFIEMADSLSDQLTETRQINEFLEQRVNERTNQLTLAMSELNIILENAPIAILKMIDRKPVWVNRRAVELFWYAKEELVFQTTRKLYSTDEEYEKLGKEAYPALAQGLVFETVQELARKDGTHIMVRYIGKAIEPPDMSKGVLWLLEDCTEQKRAEAITQARARISAYALTHSLDKLLTKILDEAEALTGSTIGFFHFLDADQKTLLLQAWSSNTLSTMCTAEGKGQHYAVEKAGVWVDCIHQRQPVIHNDYLALQNRKGMPEGHAEVVRELVVPIFRGDLIVGIIGLGNKPNDYVQQDVETIVHLTNIAWDIVAGKLAEDALRESKEHFELLFSTSPDAALISRIEDGRIVQINDVFTALFGFSREEAIGSTTLTLNLWDTDDRQRFVQELSEKGFCRNLEFLFRRKDGSTFFGSLSANLANLRGIPHIVSNTRDITDRKQAEDELLRSVKEKEVMLKEIHHRVKNNMQVIYSLLNLQAKGIVDKETRAMFEESRNRVHSMALMHEKLYRSKDLAHINFKEYLRSLVSGIADTYRRHDVVFSLEMEPLALDVNIGIPCGLIANELISNSLKYAFPDERHGTIRLGINKDREGNNVLIVSDNGIGFPETLDFRSTTTLGMQLVVVLTGQIGGTIELSREEGTTFRITFP